ncbi:MAG: peptidase [Richelia sp. RM2_1_2]|nr:peptidase [Richelia sp. SM1_7_0]NJN09887.1 peptidase [Richelia sp. RM1_1_1]NJO56870.1 peptidase [Richelia sp. RM2_1_2]
MRKHRKINTPKSLFKRVKIVWGFAIAILLVILTNVQVHAIFTNFNLTKVPQYIGDIKIGVGESETLNRKNSLIDTISQAASLPRQKPHALPSTLMQWKDDTNSGDYFTEIKPTKYGYLTWWQFPVKVYLETPTGNNNQQSQEWVNTVSQTVQEWNNYLPLTIVENPEAADITIMRKSPPLKFTNGSQFPRARSAETRYKIFPKDNILYHNFTILLSPSQTGKYLVAAARHELGHALGIWGHSTDKGDALYFSQVSNPPLISPRDVNTLKKIYQQPTSLGWTRIISN